MAEEPETVARDALVDDLDDTDALGLLEAVSPEVPDRMPKGYSIWGKANGDPQAAKEIASSHLLRIARANGEYEDAVAVNASKRRAYRIVLDRLDAQESIVQRRRDHTVAWHELVLDQFVRAWQFVGRSRKLVLPGGEVGLARRRAHIVIYPPAIVKAGEQHEELWEAGVLSQEVHVNTALFRKLYTLRDGKVVHKTTGEIIDPVVFPAVAGHMTLPLMAEGIPAQDVLDYETFTGDLATAPDKEEGED